jgi:hypothetical protein
MLKIFANFFNSNNNRNANFNNYPKAKSRLGKIKKSFEGFVIAFPDVTPDEIMLIKDKWEILPKQISNGVRIMALNIKDGMKSLLTHYAPNSYIVPHAHNTEYEFGKIIRGSVTNRLTGKIYYENDEYIFSPKEVHYLLSNKEGCVIHSTLTSNDSYEFQPLPKKALNRLELA